MSAKHCTLILLRKDDQILLAMKKRGFGSGRWNGIGGKIEAGETIEQALIRETQEEIGVTPTDFHKVGYHEFLFPDGTADMFVTVYLCTKWEGEPVETEEMAPAWFNTQEIPYTDMWEDDEYWLPMVLDGKSVKGSFTFDTDEKMLTHDVRET